MSERNIKLEHGDSLENAIAHVALERSRAGKALQDSDWKTSLKPRKKSEGASDENCMTV